MKCTAAESVLELVSMFQPFKIDMTMEIYNILIMMMMMIIVVSSSSRFHGRKSLTEHL